MAEDTRRMILKSNFGKYPYPGRNNSRTPSVREELITLLISVECNTIKARIVRFLVEKIGNEYAIDILPDAEN